jgi:hypothetical protein
MLEVRVFLVIWTAMIATSFWEAYVEGKNPWDHGKLGWKIRYKHHVILTAYHFWLFWVMFPMLVFVLPMTLLGFSWKLFGLLGSAYFSGLVIEDYFWFVVNPTFKMRHYNSRYVKWYPWIKIGKVQFPAYYLFAVIISYSLWAFFWK